VQSCPESCGSAAGFDFFHVEVIQIEKKAYFSKENKNSIKDQWPEPSLGRQQGKPKARPKDAQPQGLKKGSELVFLVIGNYFTHSPFNVNCMQIMRFKNNGRPKTSIACKHNLSFYSRS
jgi:hypothetical protein